MNKREFTQVRSILKKEIDKFLKVYKRMPSRKELQNLILKIQRKLTTELNSAISNALKLVYVKTGITVARELGNKFIFDKIDYNALKVLQTQPVVRQSFAGLSQDISNKLQDLFDIIYNDPKGYSKKKLIDGVKSIAEVSDWRAELIARTETAKISNGARYVQYKKSPEFNNFIFKWIGPSDSRTTDTSKRIKNRVGNGVTYDELFKIVSEESIKDFPNWVVRYDAIVSHYNSRHSFVKVGVLK